MPLRVDERARDLREIDRFEGGVGWIAHPAERMQRASYALRLAEETWVIDPVDADPLDDLLETVGGLDGVAVTLDRHHRDAEAIASRHDVPVAIPSWFDDDLSVPTTRLEGAIEGAVVRPVLRSRFWREVALWVPTHSLLWVPEAVGTAPYFRTGRERLGVHPMLRLVPPRSALGDLEPDRIQVGHGPGISDDASGALQTALAGARRRTPRLLAQTARDALPV